jgi:hypothetical protein
VAVNQLWQTALKAGDEDTVALVRTAAAEAGLFQGYGWKPLSTIKGLSIGRNELIVFAGSDDKGGPWRCGSAACSTRSWRKMIDAG